jgi:hypothetical protein
VTSISFIEKFNVLGSKTQWATSGYTINEIILSKNDIRPEHVFDTSRDNLGFMQ